VTTRKDGGGSYYASTTKKCSPRGGTGKRFENGTAAHKMSPLRSVSEPMEGEAARKGKKQGGRRLEPRIEADGGPGCGENFQPVPRDTVAGSKWGQGDLEDGGKFC